MLEHLSALLPAAGSAVGEAWTWHQIHTSGPATGLQPNEDELVAALRAAQAADDWTDLTGTGLRLVSKQPGWEVEVSGRAGGASEFLLQSILVAIFSPDGAEVPDAGLLTALAEVWDPDFGDVSDDDVLDALEDDAGFGPDEPSVGWIGYLSPGRAALVPEDLPVVRRQLKGGGVLLEVGAQGDVEEVLRTNLRLRDAGALAPLPRPMDRTAL